MRGSNCSARAGHHVEVSVQHDRRAAIGSDGRGQQGPAVVRRAAHLDVARLEPALDKARGRLHALEGGGVVGDEALCQSAFIHRAENSHAAAGSGARQR